MNNRYLIYLIVILALCLIGGKKRPTQLGRFLTKVHMCIEKDANGTFKEAGSNTLKAKRDRMIEQMGFAVEALEEIDFKIDTDAGRRAIHDQAIVVTAYMYEWYKDVE